MTPWNELLDHLASGPRENGTAALEQATRWLADLLARGGMETETVGWLAHPHRLRLVGLFALAGALAYVVLLLRRRLVLALALTLLVPAAIEAELEFGVPIAGWLVSAPQEHVVARIPAAEGARQRLIISSHIDSKTDSFDHLVRVPINYVAIVVAPLLVVGTVVLLLGKKERRWLRRALAVGGVYVGVAYALLLTGGVLRSSRSQGAVDSGAGCVAMVRAAEVLHAAPLAHTEVEFVFFTGEELGMEGSRAWAARRFSSALDMPTHAINLDGVGAASRLAIFKSESSLLRKYSSDPVLVGLLDAEHTRRFGAPLHRAFYPAASDAQSFIAHGVPTVTLFSDLPEHAILTGMHSSKDSRERVRLEALDSTAELLVATARAYDGALAALAH